MRPRLTALALAAVAFAASGARARADEGFWTLDGFPADKVQAAYGFAPDRAWLERVRASTVRVDGSAGTFVSPAGLVLTNRNAVTACLRGQAAVRRSQAFFGERCRDHALRRALPLFDLLYCERLDREEQQVSDQVAFLAARPEQELACPNISVRQLVSSEDVTTRVKRALDQTGGKSITDSARAEIRKIELECGAGERVACDVVRFYEGARFELHKYRLFRDVRLVFAPEFSLAEFAIEGSPFTFPQYRFKPAFIRVYQDGKPLRSPHLPLVETVPREGELVFQTGFPGPTKRRSSVASLLLDREYNAWQLPLITESRGIIRQYSKYRMEPGRAQQLMADIDGSIRLIRGEADALTPELLARREAQERALRARIEADPRLRESYGQAWQAESRVLADLMRNHRRYMFVEWMGFGQLSHIARMLVRAPVERAKPNAERLGPFADGYVAETERWLMRPFAFDQGRSVEELAHDLRMFQQEVGFSDALVKKVLLGRSPDDVAKELIHHTRLTDLSVRRALWRGGQAAIDASSDPFIALWRRIDGDARAARARFDAEVNEPIVRASRNMADARFALYGTSEYPDGNGTLRLRFGKVASSTVAGNTLAAFVPLSGLFGLATGKAPFEVPPGWLEAKSRLELSTPFTFTANTDIIIGDGERGGPMLNKDLGVIGMAFGGNEAVAGSSYDFNPETARTVGLTTVVLVHLLEQVYRADALVQELRAAGK